jgi:hypothetical protein
MTEKRSAKARKRANGEGSVTKRGNGTWMARAYLETADGSRRRLTTYGRTRAEAWQNMERKKAECALGRRPSAKRDTVAEYLSDWLENVHRPAVLPTSYMRTKSLPYGRGSRSSPRGICHIEAYRTSISPLERLIRSES